MSGPDPNSAEVARQSKSNLAFALACLPRQRRQDMTVFYAFCRIVDDIADEPGRPPAEKQVDLDAWKHFLDGAEPTSTVQRELREVMERCPVDPQHFHEIILGCEMDLTPSRYETIEELETYCYRVASAVGLVSIVLFGCKSQRSPDYAIELGHALQLTNIMRDIGEDIHEEDRVYLPTSELAEYGVTEDDLREGRQTTAFREMMEFQAARAESRYTRVHELYDPADRRALQASQSMHFIYHGILRRMQGDGFRVLEKRYRLNKLEKVLCLARATLNLS